MRGQKRKNHSTPSRSTAPTPSAAVLSPPPPLTAAGSRSSPPRHESPFSLDPEATPPHAAPPLPIPAQPLVATIAAAGGVKPACSSPRFESPSSVATVRNNQLPVAVGGWPQFEASLLLPRPIDPLWSPADGTSLLGIQHKSESLSSASPSSNTGI